MTRGVARTPNTDDGRDRFARRIVNHPYVGLFVIAFGIAGVAISDEGKELGGDVLSFAYRQISDHPWQSLSALLALVLLLLVCGRVHDSKQTQSTHRALTRWALQRREAVLDSLPAGAYDGTEAGQRTLTLADFHSINTPGSGKEDLSLYLNPVYECIRASTPNENLFDLVGRFLNSRKRVVIRGDLGQGKSLFLQLLWLRLVGDLIDNPKQAKVPLLVRLDRVAATDIGGTDLRRVLIHQCASEQAALDPELIARIPLDRVVLLLDGLDELRTLQSSSGAGTVTRRGEVLSALIAAGDVVTTRDAFLQMHLNPYGVAELANQVRLLPIAFDPFGREYVDRYCALVGGDPEPVLTTIENDSDLRTEVSRPLLLFMTTDILANPPPNSGPAPPRWTRYDIYSTYISKWLLREEHRDTSTLPAPARRRAAHYLAWELFNSSPLAARAYASVEVSDLLVDSAMVRQAVDRLLRTGDVEGVQSSIEDDLRLHCFLIRPVSGGGEYRWAHKSFFEFLLAEHVVVSLTQASLPGEECVDLLAIPFPKPVIQFIREKLRLPATRARVAPMVERNLFAVLAGSITEDRAHHPALILPAGPLPSSSSAPLEMSRQQAGNLLPLVVSKEKLTILVRSAQHEPSFLVRRGIAVGLAMHHGVSGPLEDYVALMDSAQGVHALAAHVGYNRIYYGDQLRASEWSDDGTPNCQNFFLRTIAQVDHPDIYRPIWSMTAFTLRWLLESGRELGSPEHVNECVQRSLQSFSGVSPNLCDSVARYVEMLHESFVEWRRRLGP